MVTVLRTPARPTLVRPATCTHGVIYEEPDCAFCEGRVRRYRHRIRPDCGRYFARDYRRGQRYRQLAEHQVRLDQYLAEISIRFGQAPKASVIRGLCCFAPIV